MEKEMQRLIGFLQNMDPTTDEYAKIVQRIKDLQQLIEVSKEPPAQKDNSIFGVDRVEWFKAATQVTGLILVLNYEKVGIITTKAFTMLKR